MGIKGLTDRNMAFPEIGFIRKGIKDKAGKLVDLHHFRVEIAEPESQAIFNEVYGTEPKEINIFFPFDNIDKNWDAWLEAYVAGRMIARSDGETMIYWVDTQTGEEKAKYGIDPKGERVPMPKDNIVGSYISQGEKTKNQKIDVKLKPVGRLKVIIPELQRLAYLTVHTTSTHDIMNLSAQLDALKTVNRGRLAGIPLVLRRRPRKISTPDLNDKSKRARREKWLLSIEAKPEWVAQQIMVLNAGSMPQLENIKLLTGEVENLPEIEELNDDDFTPEEMGISEGSFEDIVDPEFGEEEPEPEPQIDQARMDRASKWTDKTSGKAYSKMTVDELSVQVENLTAFKLKYPAQWTENAETKLNDAKYLLDWLVGQVMK